MNNRGKTVGLLLTGMALGATLCGGAAAAGIIAVPTWQPIYVDGQQVEMEAYNINGSNYVKLRDAGRQVGFNVYWQNGVQVDTDAPYTGVAPTVTAPAETTETQSGSAVKQEIIDQTNALRQEYGLAALAVDEKLMEAAQVRADEMAATGSYSHTRPDGSKYYTVTDCPYVTENIHRLNQEWLDTMDLELADAAVQDWAKSSGHLDHMISGKVDAIGVGIAEGTDDQGRECWYCVQLFRYTGQKITWVDEPAHP